MGMEIIAMPAPWGVGTAWLERAFGRASAYRRSTGINAAIISADITAADSARPSPLIMFRPLASTAFL